MNREENSDNNEDNGCSSKSIVNRSESKNSARKMDDNSGKQFKGSTVTLSRTGSSLSKTFRSMTTRIRIANKLSIAKRSQDDGVSISGGGLLLDEPNSVSKLNTPTTLGPKLSKVPEVFFSTDGVICVGRMIFDDHKIVNDAGTTNTRNFMYVNQDVEGEKLAKTLLGEWSLPLPRIALFMLTDVGDLRTWNNARQISAFKNGLMKAAKTTCMWIVTNGLDVGVAKLIGDAIEQEHKDYIRSYDTQTRPKPFNVIGIANEHNLAYMQDFTNQTLTLAKPDLIQNQNRYELNPMHSNFIVIKSDRPSDDPNSQLMMYFIDYLTKIVGLSPESLHNNSKANPFFPNATTYEDSYKQSPMRTPQPISLTPIIPPMNQGSSAHNYDLDQDTVDTALMDDEISFVSEKGSITPSDMLPTECFPADGAVISSMEPDVGHIPKDPVTQLQSSIIPVVCFVIQGDYNCAKLVLENLRRSNPVIVLRGSGGFADLLSYAFIEMQQRCNNFYQTWDAEFVENTLKPLLANKIVKHFPQFRHNALARNMFRDRIIECVRESNSSKGRVFLSILNMPNSNSNFNLSEFILLALFKSQNRREKLNENLIRKDLYLTLDWNCLHVALDEVLRRNLSYNLQLEKSIFEIALLRDDREDFVDLFLSHGFRIHKYLTPFRLKRLIRYCLLEQEFFRTICLEVILGISIWSVSYEEMIEKLSPNSGIDSDSFIANEFNQLIFTTTSLHNFINIDDMYLNIMGLYPIDEDSAERKSLAILTMWAVFNRRIKLCEVLWKHSDQPIHLALIISMMLERMAWFVADQNLKNDLLNNAKMFEQFSIGVLDACYRQNEKRSFNLLSQQYSDWDNKTAVDIAANGSHRTFIAHPCCQKWLTNTFNGRIRVRELSWGILTVSPVIKIILSAFLIFPMYIWIRFLENDSPWSKKEKLLEEFSRESDDSDEEKIPKDQLKLIELKKMNPNHSEKNADNPDSQSQLLNETLKRLKSQDVRNKYNFYRQRLFIRKQPPLATMIQLMWNSPITKFWTFQVLYILYLAIFSLAVIWPGCGNWYLDTTVCLWTFLNLIEHIRRTMLLYQRYTSVPIVFKIVEILGIIALLFFYSFSRVFVDYTYHFNSYNLIFSDPFYMKVILCIGLIYFYYRLFAIHLTISPTLGPLLYRFKLMVTVDFIHFMRMALILLISSGIVIQAILYPNTELGIEMFHKAFHRAAISLFLTPVDELTVKCNHNKTPQIIDNENNSTMSPDPNLSTSKIYDLFFKETNSKDFCPTPIPMAESCPETGFWPYLFTFQYLICLKLILMTLLYALFASTASKLQTETDNIWKYQRYTIVIDFANRPALHAPLSLFKYIYTVFKLVLQFITCNKCACLRRAFSTKTDGNVFLDSENTDKNQRQLSKDDYNYWRHLAKVLYEEQEKKKEAEQLVNRQSESIQLISEEMEHERKTLRSLKSKINEIERMMSQTQICLESIKRAAYNNIPSQSLHRSTNDLMSPITAPGSMSISIHYYSRHSPYVGTRINRFPIADKYVSWDVIWISYDPVIYSRKKENFPSFLKPFVDEDILALKEFQLGKDSLESDPTLNIHLPVFNWNLVSVNPAGFTIDRKSWLAVGTTIDSLDFALARNEDETDIKMIYKLDDGIPLNPFGRTGLRGKGNLARWGPNHYIMLIVTRNCISSEGILLQFAMEHKYNLLQLPIRFIGDDKMFTEIRSLFTSDDDSNVNWTSEEIMCEYFQQVAFRSVSRAGSTCQRQLSHDVNNIQWMPPVMHYLDSPENTDNAWKEVKVYHIHYSPTVPTVNTDRILSRGMIWMNFCEDLSVRIPMEQVPLMNSTVKRLHIPA